MTAQNEVLHVLNKVKSPEINFYCFSKGHKDQNFMGPRQPPKNYSFLSLPLNTGFYFKRTPFHT